MHLKELILVAMTILLLGIDHGVSQIIFPDDPILTTQTHPSNFRTPQFGPSPPSFNRQFISSGQTSNQFPKNLFQSMAKGYFKPNMIYSPLSIDLAVAMIYIGSGGTTSQQIQNVFGYGTADFSFKSNYQNLLNGLQNISPDVLRVSNGLYISQDFGINPNYKNALTNNFRAIANVENFRSSSEFVRNQINGEVARNTEQKIKEILPQRSIDSSTVMVLVNAMYFKGEWRKSFTDLGSFGSAIQFTTATRAENVPGIFSEQTVKYKQDTSLGAEIAFIPFKGQKVSMAILLPSSTTNLRNVLQQHSSFNAKDLLVGAKDQFLSITMPSFQIESEFNLVEVLKNMGIQDAFNRNSANFSGISRSGQKNLHIDVMRHKAFIKVDKNGVEAAAVTAVSFANRFGGTATPFTVDRPFMVHLIHEEQKKILFSGVVYDPTG